LEKQRGPNLPQVCYWDFTLVRTNKTEWEGRRKGQGDKRTKKGEGNKLQGSPSPRPSIFNRGRQGEWGSEEETRDRTGGGAGGERRGPSGVRDLTEEKN